MYRFLTILALAAVSMTACHDMPEYKKASAMNTALPVFMIPRVVPADPFTLQAYERVHKKYTTAVLYIEGDGTPYADANTLNFSSTPPDPVGLRLASQDGSPNVIYLARPCQYRQRYQGKEECPKVFGAEARYSEAVIHGYMNALDNIKAYHDLTGFEIVGYDGGAAIAAILAAQRTDIVSLRTVAGNLDTKTTSYLNNTKELDKSYNPVNYATKLALMPQRHFVGKLDRITPPAVYNSFAQALGPTPCNTSTLVDGADHMHGWVEQWNTLRTLPVGCQNMNKPALIEEPAPVPFDPSTLDGDKGIDRGQK